jgi:hypothetical protein
VAYAKTANWSALDRECLYSYFYSLHDKVVGKKLTHDKLHRLITTHVKRAFPIRIKKYIDAKIQRQMQENLLNDFSLFVARQLLRNDTYLNLLIFHKTCILIANRSINFFILTNQITLRKKLSLFFQAN